ncbi:hypothetical protein Pst134EA_017252 [Puccinia striiformis f. sp. tritici]|uniref:hypothetical protein n=1 Tax=Puccinia striiformis f. sp. tritici TaxID=168172 RepID=UPI0020081624|nr:hypothetical protein Pst134EA_017252 [Puccinia striiformis f. sp. tritici]KAH9460942.1 hypothetical protein Pst134EA_017252 [Puccinia striiformis f. sp. tritici]
MPRPPKKKVRKSYGKDDDYQLNNGKEPSVQQTESSDDLKNLANIIKLKRSSKVGNQSFENFEKKCYKLLESATGQIESKIEAHEENLARLYRSVEEINEEVEPTQNEVILERIISKCFDPEVTYLSRVLTDMNSGKNCDSDELQINLTELMEEREYLSFPCASQELCFPSGSYRCLEVKCFLFFLQSTCDQSNWQNFREE